MKSPTEKNRGPDLVRTTTTERPPGPTSESVPAQSKSDAQEQRNKSATSTESERTITSQENGTHAKTPAVTHAMENEPAAQTQTEPSDNTGRMECNSASNPSATIEPEKDKNTNPGCDGQNTKKQDKGVRDGRKYVPSKKAMIDPLKMDMSKQLVMPLTSSQVSLQCIECHIIFSDHKSKVRHLKLSHPAEYEQCILRNALFACYVCDRHFTNSTELMAHQKTHIEKKPFKCPICGQAFKKSSELTHHKKVHFGLDGYACTDCGKPCKTMTLLKYHSRTHTGEKPYVCKECGKRFTMSKALQKHVESHLPEGTEGENTIAKAQWKKDDGSSTKYPCSVCKATFKSTKTRLHHMKTKHKALPASNAHTDGQQVKHNTPIITPISFCQPVLLQVEPNGPLQKVDANIDTEQIRRLIESLGNVQKVNQVVILGQVPPDAPPLEVHQLSQLAEPGNCNLNPPQIDFMGLKPPESNTLELDPSNHLCDSMEHTIILEPITPDGQLENPSFSEVVPHIEVGENMELILVPTEKTTNPEGEVVHQVFHQPHITAIQSDAVDQVVCQNEEDMLKQNLEQTVILELTPALIPTVDLEQSQTISQSEFQPSFEQETGLLVPPALHTVELELTPLQSEQQDLPAHPLVPPYPLTKTPSGYKTSPKEDVDSQMIAVSPDQVQSGLNEDVSQEEQETSEHKTLYHDPSDKRLVGSKEDQKQVENPSQVGAPSQLETKQVPQTSEIPINVMSAQELVKVRKRKPARAYIFQGYMQELVGSLYKDDFQIDAPPVKRSKAKKSHLVVKFGPKSKEKKSKQKKPTQQCKQTQENVIRGKKPTSFSEKKGQLQTKGRGSKKEKKAGHLVSAGEIKSPSSSTQDPQVKKIKEDKKNKNMKKQKEGSTGGVKHISEHKTVESTVFKKKKQVKIMQKDQSKNTKNGKRKKNLSREEKANVALLDTAGPQVKKDSLLLLKGHKQPQLKVYKLDTSKSSDKTQETIPQYQTLSKQIKSNKRKQPRNKSTNNLKVDFKKKGGKTKKNMKDLSLLSSLQVCCQSPETPPIKPKITRKRKASSNVEAEGVITSSHSKRALECKDCGERFTEVSSLQKHKVTVHVIESPGLTYTNGNIFEGVSSLDLYQLPKPNDQFLDSADWDAEPAIGEAALEDREQNVSFPALIPSPSLPVPPSDVELSHCVDKGRNRAGTHGQSVTSPEVHSASEQIKNIETPQTKNNETGDEDKQEEMTLNNPSSEAEIQCVTDEDIKEDVFLEVDLVTVGEQNETHDPITHEGTVPQNQSNETCIYDGGITRQPNKECEKSPTLQTVTSSTHQVKMKEEDEEILVQRKKGGKGAFVKNTSRGWRKGTGCLKWGMISKSVSIGDVVRGAESEKGQEECQLVYEKNPVTSDSESNYEGDTVRKNSTPVNIPQCQANKDSAPSTPLPSTHSTLEESPEEQVVFELKSVTTSVVEVMNEGGLPGGDKDERDRSPGIILEKFLTSRQRASSDVERTNQRHGLGSNADNEQVFGCQQIKVEENITDAALVVATGQNRQSATVQPRQHRDIRTVLVKEESPLMLNESRNSQGTRRIRWNVEPVNIENTSSSSVDSGESIKECHEVNTSQCIFYPVKEEEREVLLGTAQTDVGNTTTNTSSDVLLTETQVTDNNLADTDAEWQQPPDLHDFLLQSSDEEEVGGFELSDPQLDSEADVMAYFDKNQTKKAQQTDDMSQNMPISASQVRTTSEENRTRTPIEYFSKYFNWDTWVKIAKCTNKLSNIPNPVTAKEVAQFVGIHVAMGTLKFPSPRLYWGDLTKVPLIAEAMPLSRFLELSRMLKLAAKDSVHTTVQDGRQDDSQSEVSEQSNSQRLGDTPNDLNTTTDPTDPLWKVQPLLCRFKAGCRSLRGDSDYAVDQYQLPLTGKMHNKNLSLHCTTLIGFGGFLLNVDLKFGFSGKEDAVQNMVPKGSMVFLCQQELSTPAMLERLLDAGVHGAGRVGGARGQIGDEFVSSDGKLMLSRSHCGFILSTAGNSHRNMASLIDNFEKAQMSAHLNRDLRNLYSIPLTASSPTCWPQAVLWYLTDLALINSWLLYRQDHRVQTAPVTLMAFRLEVSKTLILSSGSDTQDSIPPQPPVEAAHSLNDTPNPSLVEESPLPDAATRYDGSGHWPEQLGDGEGGRCRFRDCQRTSRVLCLKCCVFLCISRNHNCFLNFHNQGILEKQ